MVFLELTKLRPLDVLLISGNRPGSFAIKSAVSLRGRRWSSYSHAALILSPSLHIEALSARGIVCTDLSVLTLHFRVVSGQLAVYAPLDRVNGVQVLRHREVAHDVDSTHLTSLRTCALETLAEVYLKQYSLRLRLAEPVVRLDPAILGFLERLTRWMEHDEPEPGPFCSELVCMLLEKAGLLVREPWNGQPASTLAPADFSWRPNMFYDVPGVDLTCTAQELPGVACDPEFVNEVSKILESAQQQQEFAIETLKAMLSVSTIVSEPHKLDEMALSTLRQSHLKQRKKFRAAYAYKLAPSIERFLDPLWEWVAKANDCNGSCPKTRKEEFTEDVIASGQAFAARWRKRGEHKLVGASPEKASVTWRPRLRSTEEVYWDQLANWGGEPCKDLRNCVVARLALLRERVDVGREILDEEVRVEAQTARASMKAARPQ